MYIPPHKFARLQCQYYSQQKAEKYKDGVTLIDLIFVPTLGIKLSLFESN
jgi:hypothetical protein